MVGRVNEHLYIPTKHIVEWTQAFVQWHSEDERIAVTDLITGAGAYLGMIEDYLCQ